MLTTCQHPILCSICKKECSLIHLRRELELLGFFTLVRMSTIVYDREIFGTIILIAEVRKSLVQSRLPPFRGDLIKFGLEVEFVVKQVSQLNDLIIDVSLYGLYLP